MQIDVSDIRPLAIGCGLLGSGGGGDWQIGQLFAEQAISDHGPVDLVDVDAFEDDALILPVAMIGAPTVGAERLVTGSEGLRLTAYVERLLGRPVQALMAGEIGGMNGVLPIGWAAVAGLPLVNADGMGRAFPELHMNAMYLAGVPAAPVVLTDERDNVATFDSADGPALERLVRSAVTALGGNSAMALHPMTAAAARDAVVPGTVTLAYELGRRLCDRGDDPVASLLAHRGGRELLRGKIVDVERRSTDGFARGSATIEAFGDPDRLLRVEFQNENLIAIDGGEVVAVVPDIIAIVDVHHGVAIATELLRYGQRVAVVAFPSAPLWRTEDALAIAGPSAFGYAVDYDPIVSAP